MNVQAPLSASQLITTERPLVIGHRGFPHLAPENTLASFKLALEAGVDLIELDYRHTHDHIPIVIHDPELNRTTDATSRFRHRHVKVASRSAAEVHTLDAGRWYDGRYAGSRVPLLRQALQLICEGNLALIERKAGEAGTLVRLLRESGLIERVVVQSFDWEFLRLVHELEPELILGALGPARRLPNGKKPFGLSRKLNRASLRHIPKTGAKILVWSQKVSKKAVHFAHSHGLKVWNYTINNERVAKRLLRAGVDGIITNNPPLIQSIIREKHPAK